MKDRLPVPEPGTIIEVHVTPGARQQRVDIGPEGIRIRVTAAPEKGRATEAARKLLARALGLPRGRLVLVRGATSRRKVFRVE